PFVPDSHRSHRRPPERRQVDSVQPPAGPPAGHRPRLAGDHAGPHHRDRPAQRRPAHPDRGYGRPRSRGRSTGAQRAGLPRRRGERSPAFRSGRPSGPRLRRRGGLVSFPAIRQARPAGRQQGGYPGGQEPFPEFYSLGIDQQILISAEHGAGIEDLREALALTLPEIPDVPTPDAPPIAIVGRPNVGKSSLLNKLSGLNRALVSPVAGTTRDPLDTVITRGDKSYLLIDTAGIRRRSQVTGAPEELAVMMARRQIERAQVVVLVIDASQSVTGGDLAIAGTIWELGRAAVVAINKWDLLDD